MAMDAIREIAETERINRERIDAAEGKARRIAADAERVGTELLRVSRERVLEDGRRMMHRAEERGTKRAAEIMRNAQTEAEALRRTAEERMEAAADLIVERVVRG